MQLWKSVKNLEGMYTDIVQKKNLSQETLAELADLHRTYISAVERGTRSISLKNIEKISIALDIPVYKLFLFGGEHNE